MENRLRNQLLKSVLVCYAFVWAATGSIAFGSAVYPSINLGDAGEFAVLATNGNLNSSDSAFLNGYIGVAAAGFSYTQSGGLETNNQQATTAYVNSASTFGSHPSNVTINQSSNAFLAQAVQDATTESTTLSGLAPTLTLGSITSSTTINESSVGTYVLNLGSINLNQGALTLNAPAGSVFMVNVSGSITLAGGNLGNGLRLTGGITANDVIYNIVSAGANLTTSGGSNAQDIQGSILDVLGSVQLDPAEVDGHIISKSFSASSGALVSPQLAVPEPVSFASVAAAVAGLALLRRRTVSSKAGSNTISKIAGL